MKHQMLPEEIRDELLIYLQDMVTLGCDASVLPSCTVTYFLHRFNRAALSVTQDRVDGPIIMKCTQHGSTYTLAIPQTIYNALSGDYVPVTPSLLVYNLVYTIEDAQDTPMLRSLTAADRFFNMLLENQELQSNRFFK